MFLTKSLWILLSSLDRRGIQRDGAQGVLQLGAVPWPDKAVRSNLCRSSWWLIRRAAWNSCVDYWLASS